MSFSAAQLATMVTKAKLYMGIGDDDETFAADGIAVFCTDANTSTATVQVTDTTVVLVITDGAGAATTTLTLADAANDTLGELATVIDGTTGWTGNLLGNSDANSTLLKRLAATGCLLQANEQTLRYENEEALELFITNALDLIETEALREFISASYSEIQHHGGSVLTLEQPEVTAIDHVFTDLENGLEVKYTGSDTHATVEVTDTGVITRSRVGATESEDDRTTFAAQVTTAAMATTINALSGWTGTVKNSRPSAFLVRTGPRDAKDTTQTLEVWDDTDTEFETDYGAGQIIFDSPVYSERGRIRVDYTAGYTDLPADLETVLLSLVKTAWDTMSQSAGLKGERLGDYAYTAADTVEATAGMVGTLRKFEHVLGRYRRQLP